MADTQLKQKVRDVLRGAYFKDPDDLVDVSDGPDDSIHVVIVSRKFDGHRMKEKNDLIWSVLSQSLRPEEWGKVSLSVGASPEMFGALAIAMRQQLRGLGNVVAYSATGLGVSLVIFSSSRWYLVSLAALILSGFTMMMQFTSTNTLIQAMVPDQLRGRVMSIYTMMFLGMMPLGSLLAGAIADRIGAPWTVSLGGVVSFAGGIFFARKWPALRGSARELLTAQGMLSPSVSSDAAGPPS